MTRKELQSTRKKNNNEIQDQAQVRFLFESVVYRIRSLPLWKSTTTPTHMCVISQRKETKKGGKTWYTPLLHRHIHIEGTRACHTRRDSHLPLETRARSHFEVGETQPSHKSALQNLLMHTRLELLGSTNTRDKMKSQHKGPSRLLRLCMRP